MVVVLCLVAAASFARAAEPDSTATHERPNSLQKGARAIQFLSYDWMRSGSIYFKQHRAADHALRLGLSFSADANDIDVNSDTTGVATQEGWDEQSIYGVSIELIMQRYANVFASAHVFYGIGPFFSITSSHNERQRTVLASGDVLVDQQDFDSWSAGGRIVLGAEWFISRALSLDMEYYVSGGYQSTTRESWVQPEPPLPVFHTKEEGDEVFVSGGSARIGLGIYF